MPIYCTRIGMVLVVLVIFGALMLTAGAEYENGGVDYVANDGEIPQCYYCATPPSAIRDPNVRKVLLPTEEEQRKRGFRFLLPPTYDPSCSRPSNFSALKVQNCRWAYCIKILVDDNDSDPFVLRGCLDIVMPDVDKSDYNATCLTRAKDYRFVSCVCRGPLCNRSPDLLYFNSRLSIAFTLVWLLLHHCLLK